MAEVTVSILILFLLSFNKPFIKISGESGDENSDQNCLSKSYVGDNAEGFAPGVNKVLQDMRIEHHEIVSPTQGDSNS